MATSLDTSSVEGGGARFYRSAPAAAGERATLVWHRRAIGCLNQPGCYPSAMTLTNLDLEQIDPATGEVLAESSSPIDNVEQVRSTGAGEVIYKVEAETSVDGLAAEPYALAARRSLTPLATPRPTIETEVTPAGPVRPNVDVTVQAEIANPSPDLTAEDVEVTLELPAGVDLVEGQQTQGFGEVTHASGSRTATWKVRGSTDGMKALVTEVTASRYGSNFANSQSSALRVDGTGPALTLAAPPATTTETSLLLAWAGEDPSGVRDFDVDVAIDGGDFVPWLGATNQTSATFLGDPGHRYVFRVRATDLLGNSSGHLSSGEVSVVDAPPGGDAGPRDPERRTATLDIKRVKRRGSVLHLSGTLPADAFGRITATWRGRVGRRRLTAQARRYPRNGRFRMFVELPSRWRKARAGRLTVTFAGDSLYLPATERLRIRTSR